VLVHLGAVCGARVEALLALGLRALAGRADVHHARGALDALGQCEGTRVERVGELLVVLRYHARAAAVRAVELDKLQVEQRRDLGDRSVQHGSESPRHAPGPVSQLHAPSSPSAISPTMYRFSS